MLDLKKYNASARHLLFKNVNKALWNDHKDLESNSPFHLAENIRAPLLLVAGERDFIVPVEDSRSMYKKLRKLKKEVEYIELPDGEHWRTIEKHEIRKLQAIEEFLNMHIGLGMKRSI